MTHDPAASRDAATLPDAPATTAPATTGPDSDADGPDGFGPDTGADGPDLDALMRRLQGLADRVDGPPSLVNDLARAAFETRDLDAELAVLTADSDVDTLALARAGQTAAAPRMVSFESDSITVELQIDRSADRTTMTGVLHGPAASAEVETADGRIPITVDEYGWFRWSADSGQRVRLRIRTEGGVVSTEWVLI